MFDVEIGLPELPAPAPASPSVGDPVEWDHLVELLTCIKPTDRTGWRDLVAAVRATNSGTEEARHALLKSKIDPAYYPDLETIWRTMPPKEGGLGYGTVLHMARSGKYAGPSAAGVEPLVLGDVYTTVAPDPVPHRPKDIIPVWNIYETLEQPPPTWLVENVILEEENFSIAGPPKKGKSLFTLEVALSICANVPVLDKYKVCRSGPVVYLSGEGTSFLSKRVNAWLKARKVERAAVEANWFYVPRVPPIGDPATLQSYVDAIRAKVGITRPALIIIDTMSRALGANDENSASTMNLYETLTRAIMAEFKCSCWTIAHVGKDTTRGVRGNNAAEGNFDANSGLAEVGNSRLFTRNDRGSDAKPFGITVVVTPHGEVLAWAEAGKSKGNGITTSVIHKALGRLWDGSPVPTSMLVSQIVTDTGLKAGTVRNTLESGCRIGGAFFDYVFDQGDKKPPRTWYIPEVKDDEDFS